MRTDYADVDEYVSTFPVIVQRLLEQMRVTIRKHAPEAVEAKADPLDIPRFLNRQNNQ